MSGDSDARLQADRRRDDRRQHGGRRREDHSSTAPLGEDGESQESFFDPGWLASGDVRPDSRMLLRQARRVAAGQDSALVRVFRTYTAARAAIGVGLVAAQGISSVLGFRHAEMLALVSVAYAVQAITLWLLPRFRPLAHPQPTGRARRVQWLATIGVDLLAFISLHVIEVGSSLNYAALLVLPVLMAGVLTSRLLALGTAAAVALLLLLVALRASNVDAMAPSLMLQSGLAGLGLFMITLLAGELAGRLAREELVARGSLEVARQQAQLNRLVIEEMADGVLVVDRRLRVRAANPAARALLADHGLAPAAPFGLGEQEPWAALHDQVEKAFASAEWPEAGRDIAVSFAPDHARTLRVRVRFMRSRALDVGKEGAGRVPSDAPDEPFVVLLLEDVRTALARLRQEKLAAMGRVSAGVAHEIRNPLAAISQANALLLEDELSPAQQRLAGIVADNVHRLKRLVDDVAEVAPGSAPTLRAIDARATVAAATAEWASAANQALGVNSRVRVEIAGAPLSVVFDPEHLRRVLVNLLDNANLHASAAPGAIVVRLEVPDGNRVQLAVLSDGLLIGADVEPYLFEPFFSTRSRGSGLGLYICRELCERYGASIDYRSRPTGERLRNQFVVSLRRPAPSQGTSAPPLES